MLWELIGAIGGILAIAFMVYTVIWNIRWIYYAVKCRGKKQCKKRGCSFSGYCDKQVDVLTEEEMQLVNDLIEGLKNKKKTA